MKILRNRRGFTLLEILIVLIILAVVAGLAIPIYAAQVEKSRSQEALSNLGALRESMQRYFALNSTYTGATLHAPLPAAVAATDIDYDPNNPGGGVSRRFLYTLAVTAPATYILTALRVPAFPPVAGDNPPAASTVVINEAGVVTRTGAYS